jgi:DnaJ-class molecular chaperone
MQIKTPATLYDTLEVSPQASALVIKAAYRCLAQRYHPDKNAGAVAASERLAHINYAYSVLSNPEKRQRYDHATRPAPSPPERRGSTAKSTANPKPVDPAQPSSRAFVFRPLSD